MLIRCVHNKGSALIAYEYGTLRNDELGRFGATSFTQYGGLTIGKDYLVMGLLLGEGCLNYLIDHEGYVSAYPYPLFEVVDNRIPSEWFFKTIKSTDENYPYLEALWGYYELVFDKSHYEKLVEMDEEATRIYFRRKIELEKK